MAEQSFVIATDHVTSFATAFDCHSVPRSAENARIRQTAAQMSQNSECVPVNGVFETAGFSYCPRSSGLAFFPAQTLSRDASVRAATTAFEFEGALMKHRLAIPGLMLVSLFSGCSSIMHELQPHRLWRWNYQEAPGRTDGVYMSIDDPLPPQRLEREDPTTTP